MTTEAKTFVEDEKNIIRCIEEINIIFADVLKKWDLEEPKRGTNITNLYKDMETQVKRDEPRMLRDTTHCIFFGRTSSGKSALINALLGRKILPSKNCPVTNSFVEIMRSEDNEEYVIFPDNPTKREQIDSIRRVAKHDDHKIADCSHVRLYFSVDKCPLLKDGVVLIDTPGMDSGGIDSYIQEECSKADVLVLVVNSGSSLGDSEQRFLDDHKTMFSRFKILVVFNRWDEIEEDMDANLRKKYTDTATGYLKNTLNIAENCCEGRIFFISAKQRLELSDNSGGRPMDAEFERFVKCLKENLEESRKIRKEHCDMLNATVDSVKRYKEDLYTKLKNKFGNTLQHFGHLNDRINADVINPFDENNYEYFFHLAKKSAKTKYFECFLKEYECVMFASLQINIDGTSETLIDGDHRYFIKIWMEFYRGLYINVSQNHTEKEISAIRKDCKQINKTIKIHKGLTIAGFVVGGVLVVAAIGATAGILAPISTVIAAPILSIGGAAIGGGALGASSTMAMKFRTFKRTLYKGRYEEQEISLKNLWNNIAEVYIDSYNSFVKTAPGTLDATMAVMEDNLRVIEKSVNRVNEKWGNLQGIMQ